MTRLSIAWMLGLATVITSLLCFYVMFTVLHKGAVDAAVVSALTLGLGAVVWHGAVAIANRNGPTDK